MRYVFKMLCLSFLPLLPQLNSGSKTNHIRDIKWKHLLGGEPDYNRDTKHESIQLNIFTPSETKQNFALNNYCMRLTMTGSVLFCARSQGLQMILFSEDSGLILMQCSTHGLCTGQQRFPGWWMNCVVILLYVLCLSNFSLLLLASSTQLEPHIWNLYQSHPLLLLFPFPSAASDTAESAGRGHVQDHISHNTARILKSDPWEWSRNYYIITGFTRDPA